MVKVMKQRPPLVLCEHPSKPDKQILLPTRALESIFIPKGWVVVDEDVLTSGAPNVNAKKTEWFAYAVLTGLVDQDTDESSVTKEQLIELVNDQNRHDNSEDSSA